MNIIKKLTSISFGEYLVSDIIIIRNGGLICNLDGTCTTIIPIIPETKIKMQKLFLRIKKIIEKEIEV